MIIDTTSKRHPEIQPKVVVAAPVIIKTEKPKFAFPDLEGEDYAILKRKLYDYSETIFVDDYVEIKNMVREIESIDPDLIETQFIPKLQKLVEESNGRLKGFYIWPHHLPGGNELIYPNGRRYPKRLRQYKHQPEHKAVCIHGVEVGYLIPSVPFLHPETWKGNAIALEIQTGVRASMTPKKVQT